MKKNTHNIFFCESRLKTNTTITMTNKWAKAIAHGGHDKNTSSSSQRLFHGVVVLVMPQKTKKL